MNNKEFQENLIVIFPASSDNPIRATEWDGTLEALQDHVGGYIEPCAPVQLREKGIELLANEEGLLYGLPPNEYLFPFFLVGNVIAVGVSDEDFVGLTHDQLSYLAQWLFDLILSRTDEP